MGFLFLTWSSLEEEEEDGKEQVEDLHGCQLLVDWEVLQSTWKTNAGWSWLEEGLGQTPGIYRGCASVTSQWVTAVNWLSPLSLQVAANVLQSPKGEFPLGVSVI